MFVIKVLFLPFVQKYSSVSSSSYIQSKTLKISKEVWVAIKEGAITHKHYTLVWNSQNLWVL